MGAAAPDRRHAHAAAREEEHDAQAKHRHPERAEIEQKPLGIAGRIACCFIDSPISPLLMLATLAKAVVHARLRVSAQGLVSAYIRMLQAMRTAASRTSGGSPCPGPVQSRG